jgi:hypothetical protein
MTKRKGWELAPHAFGCKRGKIMPENRRLTHMRCPQCQAIIKNTCTSCGNTMWENTNHVCYNANQVDD